MTAATQAAKLINDGDYLPLARFAGTIYYLHEPSGLYFVCKLCDSKTVVITVVQADFKVSPKLFKCSGHGKHGKKKEKAKQRKRRWNK